MTTIYGIIYEHVPDEGPLRTPCYIVRLHVFDIVKDPTNRAPGLCFMQVIFSADVQVPALGVSTAQKLAFGRTMPVATELGALLPHSTGPHYGFQDVETGRIVGNGEFFETFAEAKAAAEGLAGFVEYINLVPTN